MKDTLSHFRGHDIERDDKEDRRKIPRGAKCFMVGNGKCFRRQGHHILFIPDITDSVRILKTFREEIGHWAWFPTKLFLTDRFCVQATGKMSSNMFKIVTNVNCRSLLCFIGRN